VSSLGTRRNGCQGATGGMQPRATNNHRSRDRAANFPKWRFVPRVPRIPALESPGGTTLMISRKCAEGRHRVVSDATRERLDVGPGSGRATRGAPSRRRSKLPPRRGAGPRNVAWASTRSSGSVRTIPPLQRPPATSTIPCEFLRVGKKRSPMMLNCRLRLRCAVSLAVQTRDQVILRRLGRV